MAVSARAVNETAVPTTATVATRNQFIGNSGGGDSGVFVTARYGYDKVSSSLLCITILEGV